MGRKKSEKGKAATAAEGDLLTASASEPQETANNVNAEPGLPLEQLGQEAHERHEPSQILDPEARCHEEHDGRD